MTQAPTATKRSVLEQLLDQGMVLVALDARVDGVDVPSHLAGDPQLRLNLSYRFGLPMAVETWGVRATLTFAGVPFTCRFPWAAIFLVVSHVSGQPYLFPDDIPAELLHEAPEMADKFAPNAGNPKGGRPKLTLIRSAEATAAPQTPDSSRPGRRRSESAPATKSPSRPAAALAQLQAQPESPSQSDSASPPTIAAGRAPKRRPSNKAGPAAQRPAPTNGDGPVKKTERQAQDLESAGEVAPAPKDGAAPRQRGHLRLVK